MFNDKIPKFYFPEGNPTSDNIEACDEIINEVITKDVVMHDFLKKTVEMLGFPKMFNSVLINKKSQGDKKISKKQFLR